MNNDYIYLLWASGNPSDDDVRLDWGRRLWASDVGVVTLWIEDLKRGGEQSHPPHLGTVDVTLRHMARI